MATQPSLIKIALMADVLEALVPVAELYDYRCDDEGVPSWLPYAQGDVFHSVAIPGLSVGDNDLLMLFMHPCTMREGARLRNFVTAVKVVHENERVLTKPGNWTNRNKVMPLPDLYGSGRDTYVADFMSIGTVASADLDRGKRVSQLSVEGRLQLQQRLIFHLTRHAPSIHLLRQASTALDLELEAQTDWMEQAYKNGSLKDLSAIENYEVAFDQFLSGPLEDAGQEGPSRRSLLKDPKSAPAVVRDVQRAIQSLQ